MWLRILRLLLGFLADFLVSFLLALRAARIDDENFLAVVYDIVRDLAVAHPDWSDERKRAWARDAIQVYARSLGKDLKDSMINALIEISVQRLKAEAVR